MKAKIGSITQMIVHWVGNKSKDEGVRLSSEPIVFDSISDDLTQLVEKSFLTEDCYQFYFESSLELNPVYTFIRTMFHDNSRFAEQSNFMAKILYEKSNRLTIKGGEMSVLYVKDCIYEGQKVDAIVILKSELKERVIRFKDTPNGFKIEETIGINLSKMDKGCIIYNLNEENGYKICIVDKISKGDASIYWKDDFLHVRPNLSAYHQTKDILSICKNFIKGELPETAKKNIAAISIRGKQMLMETDEVNLKDFANGAFRDKELAESFLNFVNTSKKTITPDSILSVDKSMVSRKSALPPTTIYLDRHFEIKIFGGEDYIENAYDSETGMHYYKLYYENEK